MNERIRELYDQIAGDNKLGFDSYLAEKFAELIVRECAEVADDPDVDMLRVGKVIKEHFGVE